MNATESGEYHVYKIKLGNSKDRQVIINMANSGVQVTGHNSDEVIIETNTYKAPPARAEGLKSLYNQVEDNTGLGLGVEKENNTLKITKASREGGQYTIKIPRNASVVYRESTWTGSDFNLKDVAGEIEVKLNNASANLINVTGPVVVNTTNGKINIKFSSLNQNKPSAISTINGSIDLTLPANTQANFKLRSIQGEIYSDFDMNLKKETKGDIPMIGGGNTIEGKTNGGGVEMSVYTINSEIYIRKSK
ncbi:MAG: hypothetical protein COW65_10265 [Cytophagales bacterium CG18_big_fil_WC_8_21_14_2_50_42_9]|nr:MAG: hypothetical protein COW65_10265 [Cytophagales bacterium CG18_big_fil_WC_8_21_14_2_50_42_9]